jgi:hypothetical protein
LEVEIGRIIVGGYSKQKVHKTHPNFDQWLGVVVCACHLSYPGSINRRIVVQTSWGIK